MATDKRAILSLESGEHFFGYGFGNNCDTAGELVFNTSMTGYQEITTDASYRGQMVTLTYPLINNYGTNPVDVESRRPWISALIVRELSPNSSNWRDTRTLEDFLVDHKIPGIQGIDTRQLVRILRQGGVGRAVLTRLNNSDIPDSGEFEWLNGLTSGLEMLLPELTQRARAVTALSDQQLVEEVTTTDLYRHHTKSWAPWSPPPIRQSHPHIVLLDCGVKENILRSLSVRGCRVTVLPYGSSPTDVNTLRPDGIMLANGPGDPEQAKKAIAMIKSFIGQYPIAGICLGHQLLSLAIGATTSRLKFGHRGANHPVKDLATGRVHITSQNHGFQVDATSIPKESGFRVSHINMNDGSVEGIVHKTLPIMTVQYHPEASPGPQDNQYLFERFLDLVEGSALDG